MDGRCFDEKPPCMDNINIKNKGLKTTPDVIPRCELIVGTLGSIIILVDTDICSRLLQSN